MATTIIVKNNTVDDIMLEDLGMEISGSSEINLTDYFEVYQICGSDSLKLHVINENITIHDGHEYLDKNDGLRHITLQTELEVQEPVVPDYSPPASTTSIWINIGEDYTIYIYDSNRGEWVAAASRAIFTFGLDGRVNRRYLNIAGFATTPTTSGYYLHRPSLITGIFAIASSVTRTPNVDIISNDIIVHEFQFGPNYRYINSQLAIQLPTDSILKVYCGNRARDVSVQVEITWRSTK